MTIPAESFILEMNIEALVDICKTAKDQVWSHKFVIIFEIYFGGILNGDHAVTHKLDKNSATKHP